MNVIKNDRNEFVISEGAPGSIVRAKVEFPRLIAELTDLYFEAISNKYPGLGMDMAVEKIREQGVRSRMEMESILANTPYGIPGDFKI